VLTQKQNCQSQSLQKKRHKQTEVRQDNLCAIQMNTVTALMGHINISLICDNSVITQMCDFSVETSEGFEVLKFFMSSTTS